MGDSEFEEERSVSRLCLSLRVNFLMMCCLKKRSVSSKLEFAVAKAMAFLGEQLQLDRDSIGAQCSSHPFGLFGGTTLSFNPGRTAPAGNPAAWCWGERVDRPFGHSPTRESR